MFLFYAIAAMSENRVIGSQGKIPWHIPEDFRWFKHKTMGGTLIMGRKTFESIGKPLPGRKTLVISRNPAPNEIPDYCDLGSLDEALSHLPAPYWVCGGSEIYRQLLARSSILYLTRIKRTVEGDASLPLFEHTFTLNQVIHETPTLRIERWLNNTGAWRLLHEPPRDEWPFQFDPPTRSG